MAVVAAIVAFTIGRKHKAKNGDRDHSHSYKISDPMPGSGRVFAEDHDNLSELEMKSRRYEDMVPRNVPRNMV